jgi:hypothetical protein
VGFMIEYWIDIQEEHRIEEHQIDVYQDDDTENDIDSNLIDKHNTSFCIGSDVISAVNMYQHICTLNGNRITEANGYIRLRFKSTDGGIGSVVLAMCGPNGRW